MQLFRHACWYEGTVVTRDQSAGKIFQLFSPPIRIKPHPSPQLFYTSAAAKPHMPSDHGKP
jgi:hypothetical protein